MKIVLIILIWLVTVSFWISVGYLPFRFNYVIEKINIFLYIFLLILYLFSVTSMHIIAYILTLNLLFN